MIANHIYNILYISTVIDLLIFHYSRLGAGLCTDFVAAINFFAVIEGVCNIQANTRSTFRAEVDHRVCHQRSHHVRPSRLPATTEYVVHA